MAVFQEDLAGLLLQLPIDDLNSSVFSRLDSTSLASLCLTCRVLHRVVHDNLRFLALPAAGGMRLIDANKRNHVILHQCFPSLRQLQVGLLPCVVRELHLSLAQSLGNSTALESLALVTVSRPDSQVVPLDVGPLLHRHPTVTDLALRGSHLSLEKLSLGSLSLRSLELRDVSLHVWLPPPTQVTQQNALDTLSSMLLSLPALQHLTCGYKIVRQADTAPTANPHSSPASFRDASCRLAPSALLRALAGHKSLRRVDVLEERLSADWVDVFSALPLLQEVSVEGLAPSNALLSEYGSRQLLPAAEVLRLPAAGCLLCLSLRLPPSWSADLLTIEWLGEACAAGKSRGGAGTSNIRSTGVRRGVQRLAAPANSGNGPVTSSTVSLLKQAALAGVALEVRYHVHPGLLQEEGRADPQDARALLSELLPGLSVLTVLLGDAAMRASVDHVRSALWGVVRVAAEVVAAAGGAWERSGAAAVAEGAAAGAVSVAPALVLHLPEAYGPQLRNWSLELEVVQRGLLRVAGG